MTMVTSASAARLRTGRAARFKKRGQLNLDMEGVGPGTRQQEHDEGSTKGGQKKGEARSRTNWPR